MLTYFLYRQKFYVLFIFYSVVGIAITIFLQHTLSIDQLIIEGYSDQLGEERIIELLGRQKNWQWLQYALIPLLLIVKFSLSAIPLFIGALYNDYKLSFKHCMQMIAVGEIVFVASSVAKFAWIYFFQESVSLEYIQFFSPLSLVNFFEPSELDIWFVYPLQVVNLFELTFWLILTKLIALKINGSFWKAFEFTLSSYGLGLLLWLLFISFLTLNIS